MHVTTLFVMPCALTFLGRAYPHSVKLIREAASSSRGFCAVGLGNELRIALTVSAVLAPQQLHRAGIRGFSREVRCAVAARAPN